LFFSGNFQFFMMKNRQNFGYNVKMDNQNLKLVITTLKIDLKLMSLTLNHRNLVFFWEFPVFMGKNSQNFGYNVKMDLKLMSLTLNDRKLQRVGHIGRLRLTAGRQRHGNVDASGDGAAAHFDAGTQQRRTGEERLPHQTQRQVKNVAQAMVRPQKRNPFLLEITGTSIKSLDLSLFIQINVN